MRGVIKRCETWVVNVVWSIHVVPIYERNKELDSRILSTYFCSLIVFVEVYMNLHTRTFAMHLKNIRDLFSRWNIFLKKIKMHRRPLFLVFLKCIWFHKTIKYTNFIQTWILSRRQGYKFKRGDRRNHWISFTSGTVRNIDWDKKESPVDAESYQEGRFAIVIHWIDIVGRSVYASRFLVAYGNNLTRYIFGKKAGHGVVYENTLGGAGFLRHGTP